MKKTADMIKSKGFVAGLWFMPFAGTFDDPWFADHQDWLAKREDGKPYDVFWGGTSLDMTNPGAREYVRDIVSRISKEWGYKYFKMDRYSSLQPAMDAVERGKSFSMMTSRGCPYRCTFCSQSVMAEKWRARSPESVVAGWPSLM